MRSFPNCGVCDKVLSSHQASYCSTHKGFHPNLARLFASRKGSKSSEETRLKISTNRRGKDLGPRHYRWRQGQKAWNKGIPNLAARDLPQAFRKGFTPWNKGLKAGQHSGIRSGDRINTWRGGITPKHEQLRKSDAYIAWRKHVFQRDAYTCQACGQRGGQLHADHVMPFSQYPELRLDILNGRTLCVSCHQKTETWGTRSYILI